MELDIVSLIDLACAEASTVSDLNNVEDRDNGSRFAPGQVIDGKYEVLGYLAEGGMGVLYRVRQILVDTEMVLKTIDSTHLTESAVRRFQREAKTSFALHHPNVVQVNDFGILDNAVPFFTMELLRGETLGERCKRTGSLSIEEAIPIFAQICLGLAHAHNCGVVHRDIKPSNIMLVANERLGTEGSVKILDFGIAKLSAHEEGEVQALTRTGEIFGSPLYMSPEQCGGELVDHRSDVYSLGCVLFEALTGAPPFVGDSALTTMMKHQNNTAPTLNDASLGLKFPRSLEQIVSKMMAKSPAHRYQDLGVAALDLSRALTNDANVSATEAKTKTSPTITLRKSALISYLAGSVIVSVVASALITSGFFKQEKPSRSKIQEKEGTATTSSAPNAVIQQPKVHDYDDVTLSSEWNKLLELAKKDGELQANGVKVEAADLLRISTCKRITNITLKDCELHQVNFAALRNMSQLVFFDVEKSGCDDESVRQIAQLRSVTQLTLKEPQVTDSGFLLLSEVFKHLILFDADGTKISDTAVETLSSPELETLNLKATKVSDASFLHLERFPKLRIVDIRSSKVRMNGLLSIAAHPSMREIKLDPVNLPVDKLEQFCALIKRTMKLHIYNYSELSAESRAHLQHKFPSLKIVPHGEGAPSRFED